MVVVWDTRETKAPLHNSPQHNHWVWSVRCEMNKKSEVDEQVRSIFPDTTPSTTSSYSLLAATLGWWSPALPLFPVSLVVTLWKERREAGWRMVWFRSESASSKLEDQFISAPEYPAELPSPTFVH